MTHPPPDLVAIRTALLDYLERTGSSWEERATVERLREASLHDADVLIELLAQGLVEFRRAVPRSGARSLQDPIGSGSHAGTPRLASAEAFRAAVDGAIPGGFFLTADGLAERARARSARGTEPSTRASTERAEEVRRPARAPAVAVSARDQCRVLAMREPQLTNAEIARRVGCSETTASRANLDEVRAAARRHSPPRGEKADGRIEAWSSDEREEM
jgi:hypothetical protein